MILDVFFVAVLPGKFQEDIMPLLLNEEVQTGPPRGGHGGGKVPQGLKVHGPHSTKFFKV